MSIKNIKNCNTFPDRLRQLREEKGFKTQSGFAKILNLRQSQISQWESGRCFPDKQNMIKLTDILGVTYDYLLTGRESDKSSEENTISVRIPIVGCVGASIRIGGLPYDPPYEFVEMRGLLSFDVRDNSMEPIARSGQRVLVDPEKKINDGDLVVADLGGGYVFKRWHEHEGTNCLVSINPAASLAPIMSKSRPRLMKVVAVLFA